MRLALQDGEGLDQGVVGVDGLLTPCAHDPYCVVAPGGRVLRG